MTNFLNIPVGKKMKRTPEQMKNFIAATKRTNKIMEEVKAESVRKDYEARLLASQIVLR